MAYGEEEDLLRAWGLLEVAARLLRLRARERSVERMQEETLGGPYWKGSSWARPTRKGSSPSASWRGWSGSSPWWSRPPSWGGTAWRKSGGGRPPWSSAAALGPTWTGSASPTSSRPGETGWPPCGRCTTRGGRRSASFRPFPQEAAWATRRCTPAARSRRPTARPSSPSRPPVPARPSPSRALTPWPSSSCSNPLRTSRPWWSASSPSP